MTERPMEPGKDDAAPSGVVLVIVAWHFPRARLMPRNFWHTRTLDRASRGQPGLLWMHRWISRRSLALTSRWRDVEALRAWLRSERFTSTDRALRGAGGVRRLEAAGGDLTASLEAELR